MQKNKFCLQILAYNEEKLIKGCLEGLKNIHCYVSISKPWFGEHQMFDNTLKIASEMGLEVVLKDFKYEGEQRTYLSNKAKEDGYDYMFIIDYDEYYTEDSINKAMEYINNNPLESYNLTSEVCFWKNTEYEIIPKISLVRQACVKTGIGFQLNRRPNTNEVLMLPDNVTLYHFSFCGSDEHIYSKITHFMHANEMDRSWFENVWQKWTPDMENIHPSMYNPQAFKKAIKVDCPEEISKRYYDNQSI